MLQRQSKHRKANNIGFNKCGSKFFIISCDQQNCNHKIEGNDEAWLLEFMGAVEWEQVGSFWFCPECQKERAERQTRIKERERFERRSYGKGKRTQNDGPGQALVG